MPKSVLLYVVISHFTSHHRLVETRSTPEAGRPCGSRGFSLIEVMVVLCILTLAGLILAPNLLDWRTSMRLKTASGEMRENLELAKTLAAKDNRSTWMVLVPASGIYRLVYQDAFGNDVLLREEHLPGDIRIDKNHPAYSVSGDRLRFNSRGGADNCTIVLTNAGDKSKRITVSTLGKVAIK